MIPLTEEQMRFRVAGLAENHVAKVFKGKRLPHKHPFDVETDSLLIEVKVVRVSDRVTLFDFQDYNSVYNKRNPQIHIEEYSKERKDNYALTKGKTAVLIACLVRGNKVTEMRFGVIKRSVRFNSMFPISELDSVVGVLNASCQ